MRTYVFKSAVFLLIVWIVASMTKPSLAGDQIRVYVNTGGNFQDSPDGSLETGDAKAEVKILNSAGIPIDTPAVKTQIEIKVNGVEIIPSPRMDIADTGPTETKTSRPRKHAGTKNSSAFSRILGFLKYVFYPKALHRK